MVIDDERERIDCTLDGVQRGRRSAKITTNELCRLDFECPGQLQPEQDERARRTIPPLRRYVQIDQRSCGKQKVESWTTSSIHSDEIRSDIALPLRLVVEEERSQLQSDQRGRRGIGGNERRSKLVELFGWILRRAVARIRGRNGKSLECDRWRARTQFDERQREGRFSNEF